MTDEFTLALSQEAEIVWEVDPATLPYVRSSIYWSSRRRGPLPPPVGRRVGYANLRPDAVKSRFEESMFQRRVFWLKEQDRPDDPDGVYAMGCPVEGVDPLTVAVGVEGEINERAWGGPIPAHVDRDSWNT